jgi:hypothetical protein
MCGIAEQMKERLTAMLSLQVGLGCRGKVQQVLPVRLEMATGKNSEEASVP